MLNWTDEQLDEAGLDKKKVSSLVRRLRQCSKEMAKMGLHVYGANGTGNLVHVSRPTHMDKGERGHLCLPDHGCVVADLGNGFDGGDW